MGEISWAIGFANDFIKENGGECVGVSRQSDGQWRAEICTGPSGGEKVFLEIGCYPNDQDEQ
jgi:hypothetical protein